ncbi:DUF3566 domain-containing protein [Ruicaihuangia caeni]|uniref:DUF3566 domain-containing protein n=1 Tax=Ruicaihuangia caeni TaxID=3042517 RepID=A0AAW6TAX7_9MICO|nr:DUF3566 domain-containing protein [Klugiella sp. YN-L-19]MDI2099128.1 DUF3566 domain-containing protein [Klugiella sp. YN-L-19]
MSSVAEKLQRKAPRQAGTKQVRLKLVYVDFWSVVKISFLVAVCAGIVLVVAAVLVWIVLQSTHVFDSIDSLLRDVLGNNEFTVMEMFGLGQVALFAIIIAALNVVVGTALGAISALLYNLIARVTGGILVGFTNS